MKNLTLPLVVSLGLAVMACSSSTKSPSGGASAQPPPIDIEESGANEAPANPRVESPIVPTTRESLLDPRYRQLSKALRTSGKVALIQEEAARLLGANPNDAVALNTLALLHLRRDRPRAAKLLLARALEKNEPTAALHNNLGVALLAEGEQEVAIAEFKKALRLDDRHAEASGNLGSIYAKGGDFDRARPLLESSYRANRANIAIANNYALCLRASKDYDGARRIYDEIMKSNSRDVTTLLNYAILLIDYMSRPKDGLDLVFKVKFLETQRKDVLARANALEKKAKSELK